MTKTIYREEYRQVVSQLRKAREAVGLSQAALALRLGRNQQWVSLMESGSRRLDIIEFAEVCLALGTDPTGILASTMEMLDGRHARRSRS